MLSYRIYKLNGSSVFIYRDSSVASSAPIALDTFLRRQARSDSDALGTYLVQEEVTHFSEGVMLKVWPKQGYIIGYAHEEKSCKDQ